MHTFTCERASLLQRVSLVHMLKQGFYINFSSLPRFRREYPLNLSILLGGGKETNKDFPSKGD